ncbi:MAG: hypothetical protein SF029_22295, partial [bacterium]|nr:hypothetical protein [bacterium]
LFYEATMEQTAVQLMSRKQRAAKLLTGDIGLTGLDALTEGEGGLEEALLAAIGRDEALLDPSELFKADSSQSVIDAEDAAFWNVEVDETPAAIEVERILSESIADDPLIAAAVALGGVVDPFQERHAARQSVPEDHIPPLVQSVGSYLDTVHILADTNQFARLQRELLMTLTDGVADETGRVLGMVDPTFTQDPQHEMALQGWLQSWLKEYRLVFTGCEAEVAAQIIRRAKQTLDLYQSERQPLVGESTQIGKITASQKLGWKAAPKPVKRKVNLLAMPDELDLSPSSRLCPVPEEPAVQQLALF